MNSTSRRNSYSGVPHARRRWGLIWRSNACAVLSAACLVAGVGADTAAADETATAAIYLQGGTGHQAGPVTGSFDLNLLVGANRLYNAGFTGTSAVMANIEAGHIWTGHETLGHVGLIPASPGATSVADRHATWVAMVMGGRPTSADPINSYQGGIAPDAQLFSGAIATGWPNDAAYPRWTSTFHVDFNSISTYGAYRAAIVTGLTGAGGARTADVVNSSYVANSGSSGLTAIDRLSGTLDAMINENPRTLLTLAAGNTLPSGEGPNRVPSPASSYNGMAVAALAPNGGAFDWPSAFSNGGPNDYADPTIVGVISNARQVIDIAAPGEAFATAYYGGETGGNGPGVFGPAGGPAGGTDWYTLAVSGTSFSAPTVAGGAALLYDVAHTQLTATPDARDARVMKAVLMNAADKTLGWDNGQAAHPNGNGGVLTVQGLDNRVGAGRMNVSRAFDQLVNGTTDLAGTAQGELGTVSATGWDFGLVAEGTANDYLLDGVLEAGSLFNATLGWFRDRQLLGQTAFLDDSYDNLDLELWEAAGGAAVSLIAESASLYNNSEHFSFALPKTAEYLLRVRWTGELFDLVGDVNQEHYGLAWSVAVPEPGTVVLFFLASTAFYLLSRRRVETFAPGST